MPDQKPIKIETREILETFFDARVRVTNERHHDYDGISITVCDMSYRPARNQDSQATAPSIEQTVMLLSASDLDLPDFKLTPRLSGVMGALTQSLASFIEVTFSDVPEFSKAFAVRAWNEKAIRILFTKALREFLLTCDGWAAQGKRQHLIVYLPSEIVAAEAEESFIQSAINILDLLQQGEAELDRFPDLRRETTTGICFNS
ncbi:MAG: hypothetical protein R3C03_18040 [Pirellulaceae bacterium]